jgi:SSS family solute:Na+ symporter
MSTTTVTIGLLVIYFAFLKAVATWAHRQGKHTVEDFFLVNRSLGALVLAGSLTATIVNGVAVTGTPALFYRGGILYSQMFIIVLGGVFLMWAFGQRIAAEAARQGVITQGEYFAKFYKSRLVHLLVTLLGLLGIFPYIAVQIAGVGKVLSGISDGVISFEVGAGICVVSVAAYVFFWWRAGRRVDGCVAGAHCPGFSCGVRGGL